MKLKLNNSKRSALFKIIIRNELKPDANRILLKNDFQRLTQLICQAFPTEMKETYYIPFSSNGKRQRKLATGKLWNQYVNICRNYRNDGIRKNQREVEKELPKMRLYDLETVSDEEYNKAIEWLNDSSSPWESVKEKWTLTANRRLSFFDNHGDISVSDYFHEFPALMFAEASDLIQIDFKVKYPNHANNFIDVWPTLSSSILSYAIEKIDSDSSFATSVTEAGINLNFDNEEIKNYTNIRLLLHIIPLGLNIIRKRKRCEGDTAVSSFRASRKEVADRFFLHVYASSNFETDVKEKIKTFQKNNKPCQAFIVLVGSEPPFSYFMYFEGNFYPAPDIISAVDLTFKTFMVFNVKYPAELFSIWTFIQKYVYKISTPYDDSKVYSSLLTLALDLKLIEPEILDDDAVEPGAEIVVEMPET